MFPPPNFDHWPLKIVSERLEICKIFKIFSLRRTNKGQTYSSSDVNFNVNVISRTALIRNRSFS